jgi:hypothetical protein
MLDIECNKMYDALSDAGKYKVKRAIIEAYFNEKPMSESIKFSIESAISQEQERKDKDSVCYINLRMLERLINSDKEYVKHTDELHDEIEVDYFNRPASNIYFVFEYLKFDICSRSTIANGDDVLVSLVGLGTHKLDELENSEHVRLVKMSDLCGDKVFSRESIGEIDDLVDYVLKRYPTFYMNLFKTPEQDIKQMVK